MPPSFTFSSNAGKAAGFAFRVALFLLPPALGVLALGYPQWRIGEFWTCRRAAREMSRTSGALYLRKYLSQQFFLYHRYRIEMVRPDLLILGSSRMMQFRPSMFHPIEERVYVAGGLLHSIEDVEAFTDLVTAGSIPAPRALIVGIDPWWIKDWGEELRPHHRPKFRVIDDADSWESRAFAIRAMLKKEGVLWRAYAGSGPPAEGPRFGLAAWLEDSGLRSDGSYRYSPGMRLAMKPVGRGDGSSRDLVFGHLRSRSSEFTPSTGLDPQLMSRLEKALSTLRARGIEVAAVLPPFSLECRQELETAPELSGWWEAYRAELPRRMAAAGILCVDATDPARYQLTDDHLFDGYHPGEFFNSFVAEELIRKSGKDSFLGSLDADALGVLRRAASTPGLDLPGSR